ncbi:nuclear transport factor 2-like [Capsicum annuum]|uniref:nuclear transport factor 2-like n=1 Tax=Capsicum annuum TaxID=4072 RepID=UPI001FB16C24|nr:nuclear transport factor 2-like [Capsicum annuum]
MEKIEKLVAALSKDLVGIIVPVMVPEKTFKHGIEYQPRKEDEIEDNSKESPSKPSPLLHQSFPMHEISNDDGLGDRIENLFEGCNAVPEDFSKPSGVKKVAPGEALQNWTFTPLLIRRLSCAKMEARTINNSPEIVAFAFVDLYYRVLQKFTNQAHRFYKENSVLSWPFHREIESVKSSEEINEFIISSHFKDKKVEVINIDSQSSTGGGVLVLVTACLIEQDNLRKNFSQTFFLAPQENGYYVLNDIFRFVGVVESSALVDEKVDENALVAPLATESKVEDTIKEVFDNSETKVTKDDQVVQKPSLTSNEKEKFVAEMALVVQNEAPKLSYASIKEVSNNSETKVTTNDQVDQKPSLTSNDKEKSVVETAPVVQNEAPKLSYASIKEQGRSSPSANTPYKNVRVVAEDGLLSTPKRSEASGLVQALTSSPSCVSKAATASTNVAQGQYKSIYIGGLPTNTTRSDLYAIVKEFGLIDIQDVQLKIYEDGYCVGFVHFQDEISAKKAVQTRYITVKGREVYIRYKRLNKGRGDRSISLSYGGRFPNSGSESQRRHQNSDGHKGEGYQQQNYRKRGTNYN